MRAKHECKLCGTQLRRKCKAWVGSLADLEYAAAACDLLISDLITRTNHRAAPHQAASQASTSPPTARGSGGSGHELKHATTEPAPTRPTRPLARVPDSPLRTSPRRLRLERGWNAGPRQGRSWPRVQQQAESQRNGRHATTRFASGSSMGP